MRLIRRALLGLLLTALAANLALTTWFRVEEHESALVLTMGRATRQVDKGVHTKLPWPLETAVVLPTKQTQELQFGFREQNGRVQLVEDEALMITGDENLVWADLLVEWRIQDIEKYLFAVDDPDRLLRNATAAALRSVMGTTGLDFAITTGKFEIQEEVERQLVELMDSYGAGIMIIDVKLQDVEPPQQVSAEFKAVTDAREAQQTKINEAGKYEAERIPAARAEAQKLLEQAEANKQARINQALAEVAQYKAIYEAYKANPDVTRERLLLETLEQILPGADIVIVDSSEGTVKYLPIVPGGGGSQ
ncbi:FtsH protease activity modulator HflK [Symbiobacterium thermophilum]|uniref:FtsH protease activity modulator HflK n=1 Tax=Symbiobacterium thermophilum TaxID=2734 RepID=UPI0003156D7A|nr:FtsH protease activity modulator HflK [Symbiobacterium thermophilum]